MYYSEVSISNGYIEVELLMRYHHLPWQKYKDDLIYIYCYKAASKGDDYSILYINHLNFAHYLTSTLVLGWRMDTTFVSDGATMVCFIYCDLVVQIKVGVVTLAQHYLIDCHRLAF